MSFFSNLFPHNKKNESIVLIDIGAGSVAGAYARYVEGELPVLLYTRRFPVEIREGEPVEQAMFRALLILGETLIREGAPVLARATGSGTSDAILVSIDAPWQETSVRTEHFEEKTPFIFTKHLVAEMLKKTSIKTPEKLLVDESILGTILNGYETHDPYGKRVHRAAVAVLTSHIDKSVAEKVITTLRGIYHTKHIFPIAGSSLRFQAMHNTFPHERDALILDATGSLTSIALVHKGVFVSISEIPGTDIVHTWMEKVAGELVVLAKRYPLPRTIFLLTQESKRASFEKKLAAGNLGGLWLSDNPPKITSILARHILGLVRQGTTAPLDLPLLLMAIFFQARERDGG